MFLLGAGNPFSMIGRGGQTGEPLAEQVQAIVDSLSSMPYVTTLVISVVLFPVSILVLAGVLHLVALILGAAALQLFFLAR